MNYFFTDIDLQDLFEDFKDKKVMIIGDVMIDSYLWGTVDRISPEAPVPVVAVTHRNSRLGGAANVALNVKAMGATPVLCTVIGSDPKSAEFEELMQIEEMVKDGIVKSKDRITTTKFRIIGNNMQMLRVDEEVTHPINGDETTVLFKAINEMINGGEIDVIVFQDYDKGVITPFLIEKISKNAAEKNIPVVVDPKKRNFRYFKNLDLFKPNLKEMKEGLKTDFDHKDHKQLQKAIDFLHENQNLDIIMVTLSEDGVYISIKGEGVHIPAHKRSISDVSGAGDTVISLIALGMASKMNPKAMAALANLAGGQVCEEVGVVPVKREKLLEEAKKHFKTTQE